MNAKPHEQVVEEIVSTVFTTLDDSESVSEIAISQRAAVEGDLEELTPEEMVKQFSDARHVIQSLTEVGEAVNVCALVASSDCVRRVREAHRLAKTGAGMELSRFD
jgi:hypothetical protein